MKRIPEPELMDAPAQTLAYARADFSEPNHFFVRRFLEQAGQDFSGLLLDLGCGPADICCRLARALPRCEIHGLDGARNMLALAREAVRAQGLGHRIHLIHGRLPHVPLPCSPYQAIVANSLLHHLREPLSFWRLVRRAAARGGQLLLMDLRRPPDPATAEALVKKYASTEPAVLRQDFYHSLLAAYQPAEVRAQLLAAGLAGLTVEEVGDRHLLVAGTLP